MMSIVKEETVKSVKRSGGRPQSEGWVIYAFEKVDGDKGKALAKCRKCQNILQNTSISRMANHRKKCGIYPQSEPQSYSPSLETPKTSQNKIEIEEHSIIWHPESLEYNIEEAPVPNSVEKVSQTAMEIINEDINRHRHRKISKSKNRFDSVDSALSSFLIACNLSFDIVDSSHFKKFVNTLNPDCVPPSSTQLKARILAKLQAEDTDTPRKRGRYDSDDSD